MPLAAVTYSPIAFFTADGRQLSVPGSALSIGDDGTLSVSAAYAEALPWLRHLFARGAIQAGTSPPASIALEFSAADAGSLGNDIRLKISDGASPTSYDIEVSVVSEYADLTPESAKAVVGTTTTPGSKPGLLRISSSADVQLPKNGFSGNLGGGSDLPVTASHLDVPKEDDSTAFSVQAAKGGVAGDQIVVSTSVAGSSFTLKAEWKRTLTGVNASDLANLNSTFGYLITASAPPGPSHLPGSGEYRMSGGVDSAAATALAVARDV